MRYENLITEQRNPRTAEIDQASSEEIVRMMNNEDSMVLHAIAAEAPAIAEAIDLVAERLGRGGRLFYVGAGTSGRLGYLDASECPPTFGVEPETVQAVLAGGERALVESVEAAEDQPDQGARDLRERAVGPDDAVVGITASGVTPYVLGALEAAHEAGAGTALLLCNPDVDVPDWLDVTLRIITGPEVITGSTRLKAGTATKMVLNMISTGAMIKLGKVYQNLMVDVQASNVKLRDRSRRILQAATGLDDDEAAARLQQAGDLKTALVMELAGVDADEARRRLESAGGRVHEAVSRA